MSDVSDDLWKDFVRSGSVSDYLRYAAARQLESPARKDK